MLKRIIFAFLIIVNCIVIFCFSAQNAEKSDRTSGVVVEKVVSSISKVNKNVERDTLVDNVTFYVRKLAHFSIYTLLGIWLMCEARTFNISTKRRIIICLIFGALYAISDEFHQSFVGGRSPEIRDVLIDSSGVLFGGIIVILIATLVFSVRKKRKDRA